MGCDVACTLEEKVSFDSCNVSSMELISIVLVVSPTANEIVSLIAK